jgi:hypothetical protein
VAAEPPGIVKSGMQGTNRALRAYCRMSLQAGL